MLLFYDFEFELLYGEPKVKNARWTLYYNDIGTFEGHFALNSALLDIVTKNQYLVVCDGEKSAIITGFELADELILYGRTCNWILTKRVIAQAESQTTGCGNLCCNLVETAFSDVVNFIVDKGTKEENITYERSCDSILFDGIKECLDMTSLGHTVVFDVKNKRWIFKIISGDNSDLILSESNKNATDTGLEQDILDYATCGYYEMKSGEETVRKLYNPNTQRGIYRWETILDGETEGEAGIELEKRKTNNEITLKTYGIRWGTDYKLGDVLRVQITKGSFRTTQKNKVIGVELRTGEVLQEYPILKEEKNGI